MAVAISLASVSVLTLAVVCRIFPLVIVKFRGYTIIRSVWNYSAQSTTTVQILDLVEIVWAVYG